MSNRILKITEFVEKRKMGFGVARLIMISGVNVRRFQPEDVDPPGDLERLRQALPALLSMKELQELEQYLGG